MDTRDRNFDPQFKVSTATARELLECLLVLAPDDERDFHEDHVPISLNKMALSFSVMCCCGDELFFDERDTFALGWKLEDVYKRFDRLGRTNDWKDQTRTVQGV